MWKFNFSGKRWQPYAKKPIFGLLIIELPMIVGILVMFGIADPNTYRTRLWLDGFVNGFNSSPSQPLYDLVNGKGMHVPLVWSSLITKFNLVFSVLTVFILLLKSILAVFNIFVPWLSFLFHGAELALAAFSIYGQTSPDTIDRDHQVNGPPWYITKSCSVAHLKSNIGYCQQAKAAFFLTCFFIALYSIHLILCIHSMVCAPPKKDFDEESFYEAKGRYPDEPQWEMVPIPETPGTAYGGSFPGGTYLTPPTPRTRAFNALEGAFNKPKPAFPPPPKRTKMKFGF